MSSNLELARLVWDNPAAWFALAREGELNLEGFYSRGASSM